MHTNKIKIEDDSMIKCHRCNTTKTDADKGIFAEWEFTTHSGKSKIIVWFHSHECKSLWVEKYKLEIIEHEYSAEHGMINPNKSDSRRQFNE